MTQQAMEELVRQAPFVFRGVVETIGETTTAAVAATNRTAVVRVIEVIRAPAAFSRLAGQRVTVTLREPGEPPPETTAVFYASTQLIADSLVLVEVSHQSVPTATATPEGLYDALAAGEDARLVERLAQASAVVTGRVSNVRTSVAAATETEAPGRISEHDPQWQEAVIDVESVLKGDVSGPVVIVYAGSLDVDWYQAPKYHPGQTGVFLLHEENVPAAAAAQYSDVYTSLDPSDVVPAEEQARVRALLTRDR